MSLTHVHCLLALLCCSIATGCNNSKVASDATTPNLEANPASINSPVADSRTQEQKDKEELQNRASVKQKAVLNEINFKTQTSIFKANDLQLGQLNIRKKFAADLKTLVAGYPEIPGDSTYALHNAEFNQSKAHSFKVSIANATTAIVGAKPIEPALNGYVGGSFLYNDAAGKKTVVQIVCESKDPGIDGTDVANAPTVLIAYGEAKARCKEGWDEIKTRNG